MNLRGIINTTKTELEFWKVCGPIAIGIILFVTLGAARHRLWSRRGFFAREGIRDVEAMV
jgi:hypothetical protein